MPTSVSSPVILEQIMEQVKSRSLDSEENLRVEVVQEILKALRQDSQLLTATLLNILKDRTLDIKVLTNSYMLNVFFNITRISIIEIFNKQKKDKSSQIDFARISSHL